MYMDGPVIYVQLSELKWLYAQFVIYVLSLEKVCIGIQINELVYTIHTRSDLYPLKIFLLWALFLWYVYWPKSEDNL